MVYSGDLKLFSGTAHPQLAANIAKELGVEVGKTNIKRFSDGECYVRYEESVRGVDAYIIQPTCPDVDKNIMELLIMIDALKRASAARITVVVPYYGYACQEKKDKPREAITAKMVADLLTSTGADRIVTIDLHAGAIQGFFNIPVDHLTAIPIYVKYFKEKQFAKSFYLCAFVDYASDENHIKRSKELDFFRTLSLFEPLYPQGVIILDNTLKTNKNKKEALKKSIPQFKKYNIIESDINNVY